MKDQKEQTEKAVRQSNVLQAYQQVFRSVEGRMVLENVEAVFGTNYPAFLPGEDREFSPLRAAIRDGQRQVVLHIKNLISEEASIKKATTRTS